MEAQRASVTYRGILEISDVLLASRSQLFPGYLGPLPTMWQAAVGEPCWARGAEIPFQVMLETSNEELGGLEAAWTKTQEGWWALLMLRPTQDCPKGQVK